MEQANGTPYGVGDRVEFVADLNLAPHGTVKQGERGTIIHIDTQFTEILLDAYHKGLAEYDNIAWLCEPYDNFADYARVLTTTEGASQHEAQGDDQRVHDNRTSRGQEAASLLRALERVQSNYAAAIHSILHSCGAIGGEECGGLRERIRRCA